MKKIYTTKMINTGGREGESHTPDKSWTLKITDPGKREAGTTNPEQLFAAGYAACFNGALSIAKEQAGVTGESTISVAVSLYNDGPAVFFIGVEIEGKIAGLNLEETQALLDKANTICPYSKATHGNIEVSLKAVE
ncbi:Ohr family peroxiredoxin [Enterococcus nangangensis]|uniref:Ohr family peroxiredoxin n=1 Tax=Enterococcus nangangensis TaxID=2559926 RepID=UPI0010F868C6|nr:Ohr family peroxiredoxin [Enterococcus nangangensis]